MTKKKCVFCPGCKYYVPWEMVPWEAGGITLEKLDECYLPQYHILKRKVTHHGIMLINKDVYCDNVNKNADCKYKEVAPKPLKKSWFKRFLGVLFYVP